MPGLNFYDAEGEHHWTCHCATCTHQRCLQVLVDVTPRQAARTIDIPEYRAARALGYRSDTWALIRRIFDEVLPRDEDLEERTMSIHLGGEGAAFVWLDLVSVREPDGTRRMASWRPAGHRVQGFVWVRRRWPLVRTHVREDSSPTC